MARFGGPATDATYEAAAAFVDRCLRTDGSLFAPGRRIWTAENANSLREDFILRPDESADAFDIKLERQLATAPADAVQLMGEVLFVHLLMTTAVAGDRKRALIQRVLGWGQGTTPCPDDLARTLDVGIAGGGIGFNTYRPFLVSYLIEFVLRWRRLSDEEVGAALDDPWRFAQIADEVTGKAAGPQREALKHLVHPDYFERMTSTPAKERIVRAYQSLAPDATQTVDQRVYAIRGALAEKHGAGFDFFSPEIGREWQSDPSKWAELVQWASRFVELPNFEKDEIEYKYTIAENFAAARSAVLAGESDWFAKLKRAFGPPNNLTTFYSHGPFLDWLEGNESGRAALVELWLSEASTAERIRMLDQAVPTHVVAGVGSRMNLFAMFLLPTGIGSNPPYRVRYFKKAYGLVGYPNPPKGADEADEYLHGLAFLERFAEEAAARGLEVRDLLHAQSMVWCVLKWDPEAWSETERGALNRFRGGAEPPEVEGGTDDDETSVPVPASLAELAQRLFLDGPFLPRIVRLLEAKRQVIFYGPPGTGKTFVAQRLAEHLTGDPTKVALVQFHPSYTYEDFVEGFRPVSQSGTAGVGFQLREGPLKRIARQASQLPTVPHILIIDEINRGNIAKVFGELYFLLEYRDTEIELLYGGEPFALPQNLWIIGTMNTADRSIALIDAALRRRFYFIPFLADEPPVSRVLARWLTDRGSDMVHVADIVAEANNRLSDSDAAIGPSYFMRADLDETWLEDIWEHAVIPYLREMFYGNEERLAEFELSALKAAIGRGIGVAAAGNGDAPATSPDGLAITTAQPN